MYPRCQRERPLCAREKYRKCALARCARILRACARLCALRASCCVLRTHFARFARILRASHAFCALRAHYARCARTLRAARALCALRAPCALRAHSGDSPLRAARAKSRKKYKKYQNCALRARNRCENLPDASMYHPTKFHVIPSSSLGGVR